MIAEIFLSITGAAIAGVIIAQVYMKFRIRKIYEYVNSYEGKGMSVEKMQQLAKKFWKWPIKI